MKHFLFFECFWQACNSILLRLRDEKMKKWQTKNTKKCVNENWKQSNRFLEQIHQEKESLFEQTYKKNCEQGHGGWCMPAGIWTIQVTQIPSIQVSLFEKTLGVIRTGLE